MSRTTQREKIEDREAAILAAAGKAFAANGVEGTRMSEIARSAEVAEGTLYLYYRNKQDLLASVVDRFWKTLTEGAIDAIDTGSPALSQLEQLATYHLSSILSQMGMLSLTYRARQGPGDAPQDLDNIRGYVRVYDAIIGRGIDRGELDPGIVLWCSRDVFYGTLEFSARTLDLRGEGYDDSVVQNLMALFGRYSRFDAQAAHAGAFDSERIRRHLADIERLLP